MKILHTSRLSTRRWCLILGLMLVFCPVVIPAGGAPGAEAGTSTEETPVAETPAEETPYRRLDRRLVTWPSPEAEEKKVELPGGETLGALPLRLRWLDDGHLAFRDGAGPASAPFLELAESSESGLGLELRGEVGSFAVRQGSGFRALAIQAVYSPGNSRYFTQTEARWTVCVFEPSADEALAAPTIRAASCQGTPTDISNFVWQVDAAPDSRWMHAEVDSEGARGYRTVSIPLLRDHDGDGYTDFVLWRRFEVSAAAVDPRAMSDETAEFELQRDELWVLRFDPESRAFAAPTAISGPAPAPELGTYHALLGSL